MNGRFTTTDLFTSMWTTVFPYVDKEPKTAWQHRFILIFVDYGSLVPQTFIHGDLIFFTYLGTSQTKVTGSKTPVVHYTSKVFDQFFPYFTSAVEENEKTSFNHSSLQGCAKSIFWLIIQAWIMLNCLSVFAVLLPKSQKLGLLFYLSIFFFDTHTSECKTIKT